MLCLARWSALKQPDLTKSSRSGNLKKLILEVWRGAQRPSRLQNFNFLKTSLFTLMPEKKLVCKIKIISIIKTMILERGSLKK
jgi:hypothetical protein